MSVMWSIGCVVRTMLIVNALSLVVMLQFKCNLDVVDEHCRDGSKENDELPDEPARA